MAKNKGTFQFAANFEVKVSEALDPRLVAASKADLINKNNWPSDGDTIYVYKGLIVDCGDDGVYRLINPANALSPDYSGWQRIDAGGVQIDNIFTYKGSVPSYSSLPSEGANVGDVYNIEEDFSITTSTPLDDEIVKNYAAGTNVAWNGSEWDPLAGAIDLSAYASKLEVSEIRVGVKANTEAINELTLQLENTNLELSKKVDIVEGSSLITNEKLLLIDSNANAIVGLQSATTELNNRTIALENSNNSIVIQTSNHENRLIILETDNNNNKTNIENLQGFVNSKFNSIELVNTQQTERIDNLNLKVAAQENTASNLLTKIEENTNAIVTLQATSPKPGAGLVLQENKFQIKLDPSADNRLQITDNGLLVDIKQDLSTIDNVIDNKINESFNWENI